MMALVEAVIAVCLLILIGYAIFAWTGSTTPRRTDGAPDVQRWTATHYAAGATTRVVVRKLGLGDDVLDEYLVAEIPNSDPRFDSKFLDAMAEARERAALFESESE